MKALFRTDGSWSSLALRLFLGAIFFAHGAQKMLGWFGGPGFSGTVAAFTKEQMPAPLAVLIILIDFFGSLALISGFLSRLAAFAIACEMVGAIVLVHWPNGFFMNWYGNQKGEGFEYHLLVIAICIALMIRGAGKWSVDEAIT